MPNNKILILNGSGGVGKDSFASLCKKYVAVKHISSVDQIKALAIIMGWDESKNAKSRKLLSDLKKLHIDFNDGPCKYVLSQIDMFVDQFDQNSILFIDIREPEEIKKIIDLCSYDVITVLVTNDNVVRVSSNKSDLHVDDYKYDYYITNDGSFKDLEETAKTFIKSLFN